MLHSLSEFFKKYYKQMQASFKWIFFALIVGIVLGIAGCLFRLCVDKATIFRGAHPWLIFLLPAAGLLITFMYQRSHVQKDAGTNLVIQSIYSSDKIPLNMAPLIFISTCITHFFGGSAGREGAALQLGGSIADGLGTLFHLNEKDKKIMIMCGMSAVFSAVFGTPLAAAIFSMEVISVGIMQYSALVPCVIASLTAHAISLRFGFEPEIFMLQTTPDFTIPAAIWVGVFAILCGFLSILFCNLLHGAERFYRHFFKNPYLRVVVAGCIVIGLTLLVGDQRYNGSGIGLIALCMTSGVIFPAAFLLKMIFTAATIGGGYKGGEIIPSLSIGALFGCFFGGLIGFPPELFAAIGMGALFCGVTNSPITSLLICFELFGYKGMPFYILAIAISYIFSGYYGLYSSQKIAYSKYRTEYINRKTDH